MWEVVWLPEGGKVEKNLQRRSSRITEANRLVNDFLTPSFEAVKKDPERAKQMRKICRAKEEARAMSRPAVGRPSLRSARRPLAASPVDEALVSGLNFLVPPWDALWNIPDDSLAFVNGLTGDDWRMNVTCPGGGWFNGSNTGYGAAGFGVFISSPADRPVSLRPFVPCYYEYSFWSNLFSGNTRGGYGMELVDGHGDIVAGTYLEPEVWDRTAMNDPWTRISGSDHLQHHLPNGEILFTMKAGETYELWIWIWAHGDQSNIVFTDIFGNDYGSFAEFQFTANFPVVTVL